MAADDGNGAVSPLDRIRWAAYIEVDRAIDRALLVCLAESADRRSLIATRALRSLERQVRSNQRGVLKSLARLEARGLVSVERRGRNRSTRYALCVDMAALAATRAATNPAADVTATAQAKGNRLLPTWQHVAANGAAHLLPTRQHVAANGDNEPGPSPGVPSRDKPGEGEKLNSGTDVHPLGDSRPPFSENRAAEMEQPETRSDTAKRTHPGEAKQRRDSEAGQESADDHPGIFPTAPDEHPAKKSPEEIYREQKAQRIAKEAARREELLAQAATLRQAPSKPVSLRALPPVAPPTHEDQEADTEWADIADELAHLGALQQDRPLLAEDGGALLLENGGALLLEDGSRIRLEDAA